MTARHVGRALLAAATFALALAPAAQAAKAVHVNCGQTITVDTKLANDLIDCPENGIVIGAEGITLDLNGHTVDGDGARDGDDYGVDNSAGHDGVTVQNGSVREFIEGVLLVGASANRLRDLSTSHQAHGGILMADSTHIRVEKNSSVADCGGVIVIRSREIRVERNSVSDHTCAAIPVFESEHVRIAHNSIDGGGYQGTIVAGESAGIFVCCSAHIRIERNSVTGNGFVGVFVGPFDDRFEFVRESVDNQVTGNHVFRNRDGIDLGGNGNTISRNLVVDAIGADDGSGFGIVLEAGQDNLIANNRVERTRENGIWVDIPEVDIPTVRNVLRLNRVREAGADGILIESTAADTLLDRNLAEGAGDDGIDVDSPATTLTKNTANGNHDLGIEGVPGMTDGGGNRAFGNGNPLQCTDVFCK